jgi:hypothetical protein
MNKIEDKEPYLTRCSVSGPGLRTKKYFFCGKMVFNPFRELVRQYIGHKLIIQEAGNTPY